MTVRLPRCVRVVERERAETLSLEQALALVRRLRARVRDAEQRLSKTTAQMERCEQEVERLHSIAKAKHVRMLWLVLRERRR